MFYLDTSNYVLISDVKNNATNEVVNGGNVQLTIQDVNGSEVAGQDWPITMDSVVGVDGSYDCTLSPDVQFIEDQEYQAKVVVTIGGAKLTGYYKAWASKFNW